MAIERMKCVWLLAPQGRAGELLGGLACMGLSHVSDCGIAGRSDLEALGIGRVRTDARDVERRVHLLRETLGVLDAFRKTSRQFLENFITTPIEVRGDDMRKALAELDVERVHETVTESMQRHTVLSAELQNARERRQALAGLEGIRLTLTGSRGQRHTSALLGLLPVGQLKPLEASGKLPETSVLSPAARVGKKTLVQAGCPAGERDDVLAVLREFQFQRIEPEEETITLAGLIERRQAEVARLEGALRASRDGLRDVAATSCRSVEMVLGYWEERLTIANTAAMLAESKRLTILKGYVRSRELERFRRRLRDEMSDVAMLVREPTPGDRIPISLKNPKFFAPAQLLVTMFGLPDYFTFDPTPFITFSFLIFFGFCFGDAIYGILLIALGIALARKYREYTNLRHFFALLAYAGAASAIVGMFTGTWAADLYSAEYLGSGNPLLKIRGLLMFEGADPLAKPLVALGVALLIGVANQLFGVVMLMVRNVRRGDPLAAVFDGGFWLLLLPGLVVLAAAMFVAIPPVLMKTAWLLIAAGAVGLVLTQGRAEKSLIGKAVMGFVSLYGIVGTYGTTTFIGDTLSYSRLLALGLTTTIVGMCFNIIANLARGLPFVGLAAFVVVLALGHLFNFVVSILGGFVHSARLTFVEFFGRFYQGGAPHFMPLGAWQGRIRVTDVETVWPE